MIGTASNRHRRSRKKSPWRYHPAVPADVYEVDLLREPKIDAQMQPLREPGLDGEVGYLNWLESGSCAFLDGENRCSIHPTRPSVCVLFPAGSDECQEARRVFGISRWEPDASAEDDRSPHVLNHTDPEGGQTMSKNEEKKRPSHEIRLGRIRAAIWENETANGTRHNVTFSRLYKDGEQWKDSDSFGRDDLLLLGKVADAAQSWIFVQSGAVEQSGGE